MPSVKLDLIQDNPYNSRTIYNSQEIRILAKSLASVGLLSPIKVRPHSSEFQLVFGHRRVEAARLLKWRAIKAEVVRLTDEQMLEMSLVENLARTDLTDYEKAVSFKRMNDEFGKTLEEIGGLTGLSKGAVSNYIAMTRLFDAETLRKERGLEDTLYSITEHHARILRQISDESARVNALKLISSERLTVLDLQRIVQRLRSWFEKSELDVQPQGLIEDVRTSSKKTANTKQSSKDISNIKKALYSEFVLPLKGDFTQYKRFHAFEDGFSIYRSFSPYHRIRGIEAMVEERNWFYSIAPNVATKIRDIDIQLYGETAFATLYVDHEGCLGENEISRTCRGSVFFVRNGTQWKIVHEHWSRLDQQ